MTEPQTTPEPWIATQATVTTCRYQSPALGILAFGFQTTEKFSITFDYYAHGRLYSSQFQSPTAIPQNEHLPITYNPLHPEQNSRTHGPTSSPSATHPPLLAIGIIGSVILSFLWLTLLRGCQ
jgi:hypothetical protein